MDETYLKQLFLQLNAVIPGLGIQLSPWSRCSVVRILCLTLFPTHLTLLVSLFGKILWDDWLCYTFMLLGYPQEKDRSWCTLFVQILHAPQSSSYILKNVVVLENFILIKEGEKYVLSFTEKPSIPTYLSNLKRDTGGAKKTLRANGI